VQAASEWLYIVPWGIRKMINHVARKYNNPIIYITENGKASMLLIFRRCVFLYLRMDGEFSLLMRTITILQIFFLPIHICHTYVHDMKLSYFLHMLV
jgi:hypothetical protein